MKKYNLKPEYIRRIRPNMSYKRIEENVQPNLIKRQFKTIGLNQIWCTDITYLIFGNKRAYLSTIIDLYDRHVVAYQISKLNNIKLVTDTLNEALEIEKDVYGLILHSDQGFQYTSYEYKVICASKGISISMSRKGTPIDDSPMESWHGILKKETLYNNNITSLEHYIQLVEEWIAFYNSTRLKNRNHWRFLSFGFFWSVSVSGFTSYEVAFTLIIYVCLTNAVPFAAPVKEAL